MTPIHQGYLILRTIPWWIGVFALSAFCCTAINGATEHIPAFFLRAAAVLVIFKTISLYCIKAFSLCWYEILPPLVAVMTVLLGLIFAVNFGLALQALITVVLVVALYGALNCSPAFINQRLLNALVVVAMLHAFWAIAQFVFIGGRATAGFFNPNELAAFLCPAIVIIVHRFFSTSSQRKVLAVVFLILLIAMVSTQSRSGWLALAVSLLAYTFMRGLCRLTIAAVVIALLAVFLVPTFKSRWQSTSDPYAYSRLAIWRSSAELALAESPIGVGLGNYEAAMRHHGIRIDNGMVRYPRLASDAHNELLNIWVELGWFGLLAVLLPIIWVLFNIISNLRADDTKQKQQASYDAAMLFAFGIPALFGATLHVSVIAFFAAIWAAELTRFRYQEQKAIAPKQKISVQVSLVKLLPLRFISLLVLVFAIPGAIGQLLETSATYFAKQGNTSRAEKVAAWASKITPWSLGAALQYQQFSRQNGKSAIEFAEDLSELAQRFPLNPKPLLLAAMIIENERVHLPHTVANELLIRLYQLALLGEPHNALTYWNLGNAYQESGRLDKALVAYKNAIIEEPYCARALVQLALQAKREQDIARIGELTLKIVLAQNAAQRYQGRAKAILALDKESARIFNTLNSSE
ncbi:MAG: O-antigen ligase family protein [Deltaproteobacteria bacterium]|nr:O-antigen ligase family protein [Deltaproteobacteria bacterium]